MMDFKRQKIGINAVLALSYLVCFARFIPIRNQIGDEGAGLFAAAFVLYFGYIFFVQEAFSGVIARMINVRMKREQYKNAGRVFDFALIAAAGIGLAVCALVFLLSGLLADTVFLMPHTSYVFRYMAPAFAFGTVTAVFSAYLKGVGDSVTDALLKLGTELLVTLLCILMSGVMYQRGGKVAQLLHQDVFGAVYGAQGCGIAVSLGTFLMLLLYILFYAQTKVAFKRRTMRDVSAREEEYSVYAHMMFVNPAITYCSVILTLLCLFVEERILTVQAARANQEAASEVINASALWGRYFGKGFLFVIFPVMVIYVIYHGMAGYIKRSLNQDDRKNVRETMQIRLRKYIMVFLPITLFISVFTKPLMDFFCNGITEDVSGAVRLGALSVFFFGLAYIFAQVCMAMEKDLYLLVIQAVSFLLHILMMNIGVRTYSDMATAIGLANLVSSAFLAAVYGILVTLQLGYRHNLLHLVKPFIAGGVSAVAGLLVVTLFSGKVMNLITLLIGGIVYPVIYIVIMALLRGLTKKEIGKLPGGEFLMQLLYNNQRSRR